MNPTSNIKTAHILTNNAAVKGVAMKGVLGLSPLGTFLILFAIGIGGYGLYRTLQKKNSNADNETAATIQLDGG